MFGRPASLTTKNFEISCIQMRKSYKNMMQLLYTDNSGCQIYYSYTSFYILSIVLYCLVASFGAFDTFFDGSHFTQDSQFS